MSLMKPPVAVTRRTLAALVAVLAVTSACDGGGGDGGGGDGGGGDGNGEDGNDEDGNDEDGNDEDGNGPGKCSENPGECELDS